MNVPLPQYHYIYAQQVVSVCQVPTLRDPRKPGSQAITQKHCILYSHVMPFSNNLLKH